MPRDNSVSPVRARGREHLVTSFEQQRAYVDDRVDGGTRWTRSAHRALVLSGALSRRGWRVALDQLIERHEILRTSIVHEPGGLMQVVHERVEPDLTFEDVSSTSPSVQKLAERASAFAERPFDVITAPLWRVLLIRLRADQHVVVLAMHRAVGDASTVARVLEELLALIDPPTGGTDGRFQPAPRQYGEYARRQRSIDEAVLDGQKAYWLEYLEGEVEPAALPMYGTRPPVRSAHDGWHRLVLPPELAANADRFAARSGCPLAAVVTAVFAALLYRYGARSEVAFGHTLRVRSGHGDAVLGPCGNLAVMRLVVAEETTFDEVLAVAAARLARANGNGDFPFQQLVRALDIQWDPNTAPLFQLLLDSELDIAPACSLSRPGGLQVEELPTAPGASGYDVRLVVRRAAEGPALDWCYDADLFAPELIARVAEHFVQLLSAGLADPGTPIAQLALLSRAEREAIEQRWNTTRTPYHRCAIHRLIEEQVARTPDVVAVEFGDLKLTYAQLNSRANRLARHLLSLGAAEGDMVALCMDRSADLVVAVVAILKAQCVIVPLDPAYPQDRLAFMLDDADVRMVVTARELLERAPHLQGRFDSLIKVEIDAANPTIATQGEHDLEGDLRADAPAYCIYTSGSTGRPKGVVVEHGALANLVSWHLDSWLAAVGTRTLLYSPISFDVSFHEIAAGLCSGATLVQVDEVIRSNPMALLEFVREQRIEKWYMPFVTLQQVAQAARTSSAPGHLKELIVGGEVLRITPEIRDFARRSGCVIHNHYGSTECIDVATHTLSGDPDRWPSVAPIGRTNVHNMNLYILDPAQQLAPMGVAGEIYGEGDCLARGYHRRPELTEERFLPSPFGIQGSRLYRMGDLGRYLPDGTIECIGRADQQVKIRGFRVEPSEIEAVLADHPAVAECVVTAKRTATGSTRLFAYVVPSEGQDRTALTTTLRSSLSTRLPDYMVPTAIALLDALPLTPSGKLDVRSLPEVGREQSTQQAGRSRVEVLIAEIWSELLEVADVDVRSTFFELGGDSILLVRAHQRLSEALGRDLPVQTLFRYPTVAALAQHLNNLNDELATPAQRVRQARSDSSGREQDEVAIIGMACRVPGASSVNELWANLRNGIESVVPLAEDDVIKLDGDQTRDPHFVPVGATIPDIDRFDAELFGYSAAEAAVIDPQQRLFLECAWEAFDDAGVETERYRVAVYAGSSLSTYLINNVLPAKLGGRTFLSHRHFNEATELRIEQGNARDHLPTRISFKLNLRGPSVNVQSTCSTALVAVHMARQALLNGECDVALAGAVSVITPQNTGYLWREGMMLSADGHCRAFDAQADGTVFGNGLGAVVLKRLSAAVADGDRIYAVVKGSAVNNDGAQKMDYSGPSVDAQADVIAEAHRTAGISADEVSYVEAHGTGTKLGDPVEIAGLTEAFGRTAPRRVGSCAIGSVKTNIGHLDEAAGVIGLIKTSLGLYHREIPPSLHFSEANPLSGLEESSFFVNTELREWAVGDGGRRIAGVSSFGMGGTNCHIVLEEPPIRAPAPPVGSDRPVHILPISGRSTDALRANIARYEQRLEDEPDGVLADICYSAATGRRHLDMRVAVLAGGVEQARSQLCAMLDDRDLRSASRVDGRSPRIGFLFTGQGSQYAGMGRGLYDTQPVFRAAIDRCDAILRPLIDGSLIEMLYGSESASCIDDTGNAQPALFAVGFALSRLWDSWGIRPSVVVGHSLGECVAACVAGVFDLEDALKLVAARGRLMQDLPRGGGMAQVNASAEVVAGYLAPYAAHVAIAAINTPDTTVISGRSDALRQVCDEIQRDGVDTIPLNVSHSFHSPLMEPMLEPFRAVANTIRYSEPRTDIVSNVTGAPVGPSELTTADYWVRHVIEPVKFDRAMQVAHDLGIRAFVELGPKPTLTNLARQCVSAPNVLWLPSMTPAEPHAALGSLQKLYLVGADVDWAGFDAPFARRRVPLPAYAFQRRRHWIEPPPRRPPDPIEPVAAVPADAWTPQAPGEHDPTPRCLAVTWEPVSVSDGATFPSRRCVMVGKGTVAERLAAHLSARGHQCVEVPAADSPSLRHAVGEPVGSEVVLVVEAGDVEDSAADAVRLLADTRLILEAVLASPEVGTLWIVTSEGDLGTATTERELGQSGAAALARTVTAEHPELRCVALSVPDSLQSRDLDIVADLVRRGAPDGEEQLAVHSASLYRPRLRPLATSGSASAHNLPIRSGGTYLITGGTGGLGLQLALAVARLTPRRLVLVSRRGETAVSDAATWAELAATGVEVETLCADVVDESRMRKIVEDCGPDLRGIFHLAGALEDGILLRQTAEQLPGIVGAKINGAWMLHRLTQDRPLDFFVMFSSLASILGYRGQSSYGVANAFLDALARHRRRSGLPALSVSWGSWAGVGMTARMSEMHRARLEEEGERPMSPAAAIGALAAAMSSEAAHLVVADIDWRSFAAARGGAPAMIEALVEPIGQAGQHADPVAEMDFAARLREAPPEQARTILRDTVAAAVESLLGGVPGHEIDPTRGFEEMGLDSLAALDLRAKLQTELGIRLPATLAFEQPCLDALTQHLEERHFASAIEAAPTAKDATDGRGRQGVVSPAAAQVARDAQPGAPAPDRVAIIGVSCRFPKASSLDDFWELLIDGSDAVREIPPERWDVDALYDASPDAPGKMYVRNAALIDHVDCFDAAFFGISPREAASMDPRHRLLLEAAWSAVESAGIDPASLRGSDTAVYLGGDEFINDYLQQATDHLGSEPYMATGTTLSFTAGRLSYKLGLHGPSMVIATACSSSLVALHSAVQAIRQGECSTAVVGSAKLMLGPDETVQLCKLRALAPDGRSKVFSAEADGFGRGEGCAVVVLKRLDRALADGNPILAVIRGTAVNHDGPSSGLTVPNGGSQARLITRALAQAGVEPADVTYLETHGTGTQLGDPIELNALGEVFAGRTSPLLVGSVKANIGHLEEASGLAGVIKAVLMLRHRMIPRQIHCDVLSDNVDWADLPLEVPRTLMQWPDAPAIAAVSSFGMSGTNAHVVLEAFDVPPASRSVQRRSFVFPLSARDEEDLHAMVRQLVDGLSADHDVAEVAYTLQIGRKRHRCRLAVVASDMQALRTLLQAVLNGAAVGSEVVRGDGAGEVEGRPLATEAALQLLADEELATLATLWCEGYVVDWSALCGATIPRRVPLPTYPFKRERVWLTSRESIKAKVPSPPEADASERRQNGHPEVAAATATQLAASSGSASGRDASASPPQGEPVASSNGRDSGAPALPAVPGAAPQPVSHPASAVIDALRAHLAELFGTVPDGLSLDAPFDELGADSLTFMRVSQFVRDRFHVTLSFQQLIEDASTLQELAAIVSSKMPASAPDWSPEPAPSTKAAPSTKSEPAFRSGPSSLGMSGHQTEGLTEQQARFLAELIDAYTARTAGSKAEAERDRSVMANCRTLPFQSLCKEMTYPIVVDRSAGSRFWDIDGNEYLDISIGYGVHFFGHQPDFIVDALREQLEKGVHIGPQASQSGNVARLLCELTGMSRAVFCSSGTEAVMASLRFARAATGRTRFVMFEGSYHGWSDPTLALPAGPRGSIPMARGIGAGAMSDVVVLEYGAPESLETIRALAPELAAVLVEPVQSRRPDLQPVEFLRELRQITRAAGAALVFDEIITGFRIHPGGAQAWAGVDADLVVYGKILGGGMPIGAIAGRPEFMDTVDGGAWSYGDDSSPTVPTTFFGGTFNRNPMSMAAAQAVLTRLKAEGPQLQQRLGDTVTALADEFNAFCREEDFPLQVVHFASLFRFIGEGDYSLQRFPIPIDLFFYMLALQGIYVLESRVCFLSVSHTADDVQHIVETAKSCLRALRAGGFFPTSKAALPPAIPVGNRLAEDARLDAAFSVPALRAVGPPDDVLLTGGTGFLGAHLAAELLRATPARVHCVARADDAEQAKNRVIGNLEANGCWDNAFAARIVGIPGDLARPGLGLADTTWRELAETIDAIYHNGAHVHSLLSYDKLRAPNVEGTHELLRLAVDGTAKAFHYISTDAVFDAHGYLRQARIYEDEPLTHADTLYGGGYAETKWVADNLVAHARAAGLHASIYRPGTVTGALAGGCGQVGDYFTRFIRGSIQLGICPDIDATIDLVPVDVVAQSIVALSHAKNGPGTFHLAHPEPIGYGQLVQAIRDAGYPLEIVPLHVWEAALADLRYEDDNALYPLLPLFLESSDPIFRRARLDARNTVASATAFRKTCPPLVDLIPTYLERFRAEGLLELRGREPVAR